MTLEYYNLNAEKFFKDTINVSMKQTYEKFLPRIKPRGKLLDLGCGSGRDTKAFSDLGYEVVAIDASEKMVELAAKHTGLEVQLMHFKEIKWKNYFDGLWACASLLHLSKSELRSVGMLLYESLKKGGSFYFSFKYGELNYIKNGRFFQCYTEEKISEILNRIGFSNEQEFWTSADLRPGRKNELWLNGIVVK